MKSETPLVDAMIMFMREFKVLGSAESLGVLRKTLNQQQLEQYGEPIIPEYVYDAIMKDPYRRPAGWWKSIASRVQDEKKRMIAQQHRTENMREVEQPADTGQECAGESGSPKDLIQVAYRIS